LDINAAPEYYTEYLGLLLFYIHFSHFSLL